MCIKLYLRLSPTVVFYLTTITIISIISLMSQNGNGSLESNSSSNDLPQNTSQQTWELFTDPENEFSMDYQPSWQLKPAENRFDRSDISMANTEGPPSGFVNIQYNILSEKITSMMKEFGYDQKDMENQLESVFPSLVSSFTDYESFTQIEDANYDKYKIDGYKAGSFVFSFEQSGVPYAGWVVGSLIGNKQFVFTYVADQNQFDTNLPIAEHMLNSIKILDKGKPDT
jgi:hypothetical protein